MNFLSIKPLARKFDPHDEWVLGLGRAPVGRAVGRTDPGFISPNQTPEPFLEL